MDTFRTLLANKSFETLPGTSYNKLRLRFAEEESPEDEQPMFYEVVVADGDGWQNFRNRVYPQFVRYMKSKRLDPIDPQPVIVSIFMKDECYLIEGPDFVGVLREIDRLDDDGLKELIRQWLPDW